MTECDTRTRDMRLAVGRFLWKRGAVLILLAILSVLKVVTAVEQDYYKVIVNVRFTAGLLLVYRVLHSILSILHFPFLCL